MVRIDPNEPCPCNSGLLFKECHGPKVKKPQIPKIIHEIFLNVIPEPDPYTREVFLFEGEGTIVFTGYEVGLAMLCGRCKSQLIVGIPRENIQNIVIRCRGCGAYNEV